MDIDKLPRAVSAVALILITDESGLHVFQLCNTCGELWVQALGHNADGYHSRACGLSSVLVG